MGVDLFDALGGSVQLDDTNLVSYPIAVIMSSAFNVDVDGLASELSAVD